MSFLAPVFLVKNLDLIALILGAVTLVVLSDFMNKNIVFPVSDYVKKRAETQIKRQYRTKAGRVISKYFSEGLATTIFVAYCWFGSIILAEYIYEPIINRLRAYIIIVIIVLFFIISYIINTKHLRNSLLKV